MKDKRSYDDRKDYRKQWTATFREKHKEKLFAKEHYGMSFELYQQKLIEQKGLCEICNDYIRSNTRPKRVKQHLVVDHNHQTGKYRGLLCQRCNTGLGDYEDNVDYLQKAILYLNKYKEY